MTLEEQAAALLQLTLAALLSMTIGLNRERRAKDAGLRTHTLVGMGACLFTILSMNAFAFNESARVASNIVTGIGFLGAGVIYKGDDGVHDLTTAASIWATAALGMAVGVGAWLLAMGATVLVWGTLDVLWRLRRNGKRHGKAETAIPPYTQT